MSSGVPIRPAGTVPRYASLVASGTSAWRSTGLKPGATVFTVMPKGASSAAQLRVKPICGGHEAEHLGLVGDVGVSLPGWR